MNYGLPYQGSKNAIAVAYAWFVWQKGFRGVTEVLWI